jgi:NADH dehydrogenase FAD-containing subunit
MSGTVLQHYDVAILGAGYAGLMAALHLRKSAGRQLRVALVNADDHFVERARLQESIAQPVAARIPSIAALVAGTGIDFIQGWVASLDADTRRIGITSASAQQAITFDRAVYAFGSRTDVEAVPGVEAHAYRLDPGDHPRAAAALRARLTDSAERPLRIVIVGGGVTAIEAAGEIKAHWLQSDVAMISRSRCGAFKGPRIERALRAELGRLAVGITDHETVADVQAGGIVTASGRIIAADVTVWCGGLRASPLARQAGLATDAHGRIFTDPQLRSISHPHIFAVGDAAHPVAPTGAPYRMSVLAALTSGAYVAEVLLDARNEQDHRPFSFSTFGQGIAIGHSGIGFPAFPDDQQRWFVIGGRVGFHTRNLFVWFSTYLIKNERKHPGFFSFIWSGQRRVSWQRANDAMQRMRPAQPA